MALSVIQKDFLVARYAQLLHTSNIVLLINYSNFDKTLKQVRKDLFKQQIFVEVLSSKVFSRNYFPLGGAHIMFLMSSLDQLSLIPDQYRKHIRLVITEYNVYPYSLFENALKQPLLEPSLSITCIQTALLKRTLINFNLQVINNLLNILRLNNAHC